MQIILAVSLLCALQASLVASFSAQTPHKAVIVSEPKELLAANYNDAAAVAVNWNRRAWLRSALTRTGSAATAAVLLATTAGQTNANAAMQDTLDIETFLRTGVDAGGGMGVSSQAGKSRPVTGVIFRDGSDVSQAATGAVAAEILTGTKANPKAVLVSFASPWWKLETGPVFDIECRDGRSGDGAFVAVTRSTGGKSLANLPDSFFLERLFDPTGRYSFYGAPTDIKVKKSYVEGNSRYMDISFSNLSQSTNSEIPRKAFLVATIPDGTDSAVMLVGSANASRWSKGSEKNVRDTVLSFRAVPAPKTSMKLRAKVRGDQLEF
jgi:hypothetical protein